jgi:U3 small nucleolar ribonucleoprotein component
MNNMPEKSVTDRKKLMLPQEISEVFSQLGLQEEKEREKFRSLAEVKQPENESVRILLSGTTAGLKDAQGGNYA